uniref:Radial spoke head component 4A n=1 Tax=Salarias fasciatus TaxID=181472 RepID=A0A672G256_SALFA
MLDELLEELRSGSGSRSGPRGDREPPQRAAMERLAELQKPLFTKPEDPQEVDTPLPNVSKISFYLEQAGVGLGQVETFRISLAIRQLVESEALPRCRLWGKILGTRGSYIVVEAEYRDGEQDDEPDPEEEDDGGKVTLLAFPRQEGLPQPAYRPPPAVPREAVGTGANRFMYYVCSEPGLPWVKLPPVTPAQVTAARSIYKLFTGNLDSPVVSYPPFPGNEANYLRAQIARISAGTHVSPQGFYQLGEDEACEPNPDFEDVQPALMCDLSAWVHHMPHILQQGRCTWANLSGKRGDDSNEEGEAEEEEEEPEEMGPQLLTPLSLDAEMFGVPPWTCRLSSTLVPQHAVAVLRSNLWPGAHAYASGKKFENFYVGWGLKYCGGGGFSPQAPPPPQTEYPEGPELAEVPDPSLEDEQALRDALEERHLSPGLDEDDDEEDDEDDEDN